MAPTLCIAQNPAADRLLADDQFALLIGMTLDQQFPMEAAFTGPYKIEQRMGSFDVATIAAANEDDFVALCSTPPAIHRFPKAMATRIQEIARLIVEQYDGRTEEIWSADDPDAQEVFDRLTVLPGWGAMKAKIFIALLAKQLDVQPAGWQQVAGDYSEPGSRRSVADVVDAETLQEVREFKRKAKAAAKQR
ncbi:HhH-GPD-type base excision DNA repair protein [Skermania piniformis]|uniref:Fe-S cluster assembly protein HesB n=1 Tax=Skermania pinensis TaxID=39122 RepID=A0ABX8S8J5_9ACTN|nr:HhH-GPD-type base excision DNA repair protein [Skermania piniformis]QXQ14137.1 Fe-S cluster assembly protein HesB [Skermania piniformis]